MELLPGSTSPYLCTSREWCSVAPRGQLDVGKHGHSQHPLTCLIKIRWHELADDQTSMALIKVPCHGTTGVL